MHIGIIITQFSVFIPKSEKYRMVSTQIDLLQSDYISRAVVNALMHVQMNTTEGQVLHL